MIRVLDPGTIGQIAAGEVIERPLSVVKELVENAIDAGAARIDVHVVEGGFEEIEVTDDGAGIATPELALAVRRHATSKLERAGDLNAVNTLGFRGEGLASIAAVSRIAIVSRPAGQEVGAQVVAHCEETSSAEPFASPLGTRVCVRRLFANVPVRREYLRSPAAEFTRISNWLAAFALAYPEVTFSLARDGRETWVAPAGDEGALRLRLVFGKAPAHALLPLEVAGARGLRGSLAGFISSPGNDRPDRRMQLLFVNGRLLRSGLLAGAWSAGYSTFAMSGRQPYGVLFAKLPADHVDANVHPTKSDVRLRFGDQVFDAVRRSIADTLHKHAAQRFHSSVASAAPAAFDSDLAPPTFFGNGELKHATEPLPEEGMRVVAQLNRTYVVATSPGALILIDQHAAHERVAYESILARASAPTPGERLLVPLDFEVDVSESSALERMLDVLQEGGLEIEPFGVRSFRIVATPAGYGARTFDVRGLIADLGGEFKGRDVRERVWASLACHSVVRAGERLEYAEMQALVERLERCRNPMHCPHGRPTVVRLEAADLAKLFKRI